MTSTVYKFGVRFWGDAAGLARAAKEAETAVKSSGARSVSEYRRMAQAREVLGVKSEREVQREIQRTEAAYNRLARSGTLSWNEQRMAARKMREEVTRLNNDMGRLTTRQKIAMGAKGVAAVGAGVGVATAIAAPRIQKAIDYDTRLAYLANTAFGDQDNAKWAAGMRDIGQMVVDAVRSGGGTRDSAVGSAEELFGAGIFKPEEIKGILREAVRAGTANNAESAAFARMAITANQTMGIKADRMGALFGMGTFAGQKGGFEIKDMAKWLPQQMAAAKAVGMAGEAGFAKLAALNQAAVTTAGTRDEAGNNVVNLMAKLASQDTIKDFKKTGVDLPKHLAEGRMKGLDALDVVGDLLQQQLGKDKNYQQVQKQLANAKNDADRRAALESVGNIAQGTVIGRVFQDRQALMALYGFMQGRDRVTDIAKGAMANTGASDVNFNRLATLPGYQVQQAKNEAEIAAQHSLDKLTPAIGTLAVGVTGLMQKYPGYTTAVAAATAALVSLAGSAAALALIQGRSAAAGGFGLGALASRAGAVAGTAGVWGGGTLLAGAAGYGVGTLAYKGLLDGNAGGNLLGRGLASGLSFFGSKDAEAALRSEAALGPDNMPAPSTASRTGRVTGPLPMLTSEMAKAPPSLVTLSPGKMPPPAPLLPIGAGKEPPPAPLLPIAAGKVPPVDKAPPSLVTLSPGKEPPPAPMLPIAAGKMPPPAPLLPIAAGKVPPVDKAPPSLVTLSRGKEPPPAPLLPIGPGKEPPPAPLLPIATGKVPPPAPLLPIATGKVPPRGPVRSPLAIEAAPPLTVSERLNRPSDQASVPLQQDFKGEIRVHVSGAPGLNVDTQTRSNSPRIPFRTDAGRSNLNAGF
jgi:hypothetical protein